MVSVARYDMIRRDVRRVRERASRLLETSTAIHFKTRLDIIVTELDEIASYVLRQATRAATPLDEAMWLHAASQRLEIATATVDDVERAVADDAELIG